MNDDFFNLERKFNARLGIFAIDTGSKKTVNFRGDERFPFASTYKALAVGALLQQKSINELDEIISFKKKDLVPYSPITEQHIEKGMTLKDIADAAIRYSDNTAGNILLKKLGGPSGFEMALRQIGDSVTISSRYEPELNDVIQGDIRDTSTPRALATSLQAYSTTDLLPVKNQELLNGWLRENTTGDTLIRAGVPKDWDIGDKSGAGSFGTRNDLAIVWQTVGEPIVIAILSTKNTRDANFTDVIIADAARIIIRALK